VCNVQATTPARPQAVNAKVAEPTMATAYSRVAMEGLEFLLMTDGDPAGAGCAKVKEWQGGRCGKGRKVEGGRALSISGK
jgi:hypothetical protein